jgi:hypothetical protein
VVVSSVTPQRVSNQFIVKLSQIVTSNVIKHTNLHHKVMKVPTSGSNHCEVVCMVLARNQ